MEFKKQMKKKKKTNQKSVYNKPQSPKGLIQQMPACQLYARNCAVLYGKVVNKIDKTPVVELTLLWKRWTDNKTKNCRQ